MSKTYRVEGFVYVTVEFEDDGETDLRDQAFDALQDCFHISNGEVDDYDVQTVEEKRK